MKPKTLTILIISGMVILYSCVVQKGKERPKPEILKLLISVSLSPCSTKSSQFTAEIYTGQKMIYHGISRMPVLGKYSYLIPEQMSRSLLSEAERLKLSELPDSITSPEGEQRVWLKIQRPNGTYKSLSAGMKSLPASLSEFLKRLSAEVNEMVSDQEGEKIP
jgi:hypothetical protein